jgi:hypothetical protein
MISDNVFQEGAPATAGTVLTATGAGNRPTFQAPSSFTLGCTALTGTADALPLLGAVFVAATGVDAMTLATPVAGGPGTGNDGQRLRVTDAAGHAHTITTAADKIAPSHDTITFNGTVGSFVELIAYNGLWYVGASSGVSLSEV